MKKILTAIALIVTSFASAQIVNIPDPQFKSFLLYYSPVIVDINHDGEIQVSEALAVTHLSIGGSYMDITGIKEFANLDTLDVNVDHMLNLDLSNMIHLRKLSVSWASNSFNISGCNNLEYLGLGSQESVFPDLTLSLPRLKIIDCWAAHVGNMILTACDSLRKLSLGHSYSQEIQKLDISGLTQIDTIKSFFLIHRLIARNCTGLKSIQADGYPSVGEISDELDVTGCTNLDRISLLQGEFHTLDLSSCINLRILFIFGATDSLVNLNLKNGRQLDSLYLYHSNTALPMFVCADGFEIDSVSHMLNGLYPFNLNPRPFFINTYCSFFPGGTYNTIKGKLRLDLNNNGCDNADAGMPNVRVKLTDTTGQYFIATTDSTGDYKAFTYKGIFSIHPYFPYPYFTVNPTNTTVTFDTANNLINTSNFCIRPNGVHNDLEITFLPQWPARPGFFTHYSLVYKNKGTTTLSGNVQVNFDNSKMNLTSTTTPVSSQTAAGQLTWNYNNLLPFESRTIVVGFTFLPSPVNNIGDTLIYLATVNPTAGDETPADNSFILPQRLIGSYDPNDKECLEGSKIALADIGKYLHYIIHFQNLGNDTAFNIVVADTLSNKFDWNSVELISSSHTCDVKQNNGKLEFFFRDIKLPYKAINDAGSNGFVAFKIKPKSSVTIGDSLNNKAAIYFDFNPPVITNTATTIVSLVSPIPVKLEYFSGSKKNETNVLTWKAPSTNGSTNFSIERSNDGIHFSSIGNFDATNERCQLPFNYTDNNPLPGKNYYRLKITDVDRIIFYSKILLLENNKTGIEIFSVISNRENSMVYFNAAKQQTIQLKVIAADGKTVYSNSRTISSGYSNIDLLLNKISTGVYTLIVYTNEGKIITKRFVK